MLRTTTPCTFSTSQLPKVVRTWCVLYILTSKCASRWSEHALYILTSKCASRRNGMQFFISHLARWLRTRRFSDLLFDPPEPQIIGKTQCFATFLPFRASASSFFWLFLFSDLLSSTLLFSLTLPISAFHLSILSEVWLLNFLRIYIYIYIYVYLCIFMYINVYLLIFMYSTYRLYLLGSRNSMK